MASTEINTTSYLAIADDYAAGYAGIEGLPQHYYDAAYEVLILSVFDPELDLLRPFYNAYLSSAGEYANIPIAAISAVTQLQAHILARAETAAGARYTDINDWYSDKGICVPQDFATISQSAGFTVTSGNIC